MKKILLILACSLFVIGAQAQTTSTKTTKATTVKKAKGKKAPKDKKSSKGKSKKFTPVSEEPSIALGAEFVEFGTIAKGSEPFRTISVMNMGAKPLLISNCSGSCGCTVPTCPTQPILPGESAEIKVRYDTERLGAINKTVTIFSNDPANPRKELELKAMIQ